MLLFARIFPESAYFTCFLRQWEYVKKYVLDREQGDWFEGGLDAEPRLRTGPKSHIWKCTYHTGRALMNCIALLWNASTIDMNEGVLNRRNELREFVDHWRRTARAMAVPPGEQMKSR